MKAIIVDIDGKYAVAMDKKGAFIKLKNNTQYRVGYEVDIPSGIVFNLASVRKIAAVAAAFVFVAGVGIVYTYNKPYSYINVDINPSVELTTNVFDRVIDVKAFNDDGTKIVDKDSCKNKDIKAGIEIIIKNALEKGYLKDNTTSAVMFTVSSKSESKTAELEEEVQTTAEKEFEEEEIKPDIWVEKVTVDKHDEAVKLGISPGKMLLIQKLVNTQPELKVEDLKNAPVKEIVKKINAARKENKKGKETGNTDNQGGGVQATPTHKEDISTKEPKKVNGKDRKDIDKDDNRNGKKIGQIKEQEGKNASSGSQNNQGTQKQYPDKKGEEKDTGKSAEDDTEEDDMKDNNQKENNKDNIGEKDNTGNNDKKNQQAEDKKKDDIRYDSKDNMIPKKGQDFINGTEPSKEDNGGHNDPGNSKDSKNANNKGH